MVLNFVWLIFFINLFCWSNADAQCNFQLLSGGNHDIDIDDLRNNTKYTGGYSEGSRTIKLFWEVLHLLCKSLMIQFFLCMCYILP